MDSTKQQKLFQIKSSFKKTKFCHGLRSSKFELRFQWDRVVLPVRLEIFFFGALNVRGVNLKVFGNVVVNWRPTTVLSKYTEAHGVYYPS